MKAQIKSNHQTQLLIPGSNIIAPGQLGATIEWFVTNPDGAVVLHQPPKRSESFVENFLKMLMVKMEGRSTTFGEAFTDTGGATVYLDDNNTVFDVNAAINIATYGIVVGTDNTAPTVTDTALVTQIAHGVGAGQLQYSATTFGAPASDATTSQFTVTRNFANGSGGAITVQEVGLYTRHYPFNGASVVAYVMLIRDVIAGGISVLNGQTLTINYRPQAVI